MVASLLLVVRPLLLLAAFVTAVFSSVRCIYYTVKLCTNLIPETQPDFPIDRHDLKANTKSDSRYSAGPQQDLDIEFPFHGLEPIALICLRQIRAPPWRESLWRVVIIQVIEKLIRQSSVVAQSFA